MHLHIQIRIAAAMAGVVDLLAWREVRRPFCMDADVLAEAAALPPLLAHPARPAARIISKADFCSNARIRRLVIRGRR
jgi:hypothetical protein